MLVDWKLLLFVLFCIVTAVQLFYYLYYFARLAFYKPAAKARSQQHPVSVVICACNEAKNLANYLPGVLLQEYKTSNEVIVVNDNSSDDSIYVLNEIRQTFKNLYVINLEQRALTIPGKKYPLSLGLKAAKYEIVLLTDADCVPATEYWMEKMQAAFDEHTDIVISYGAYHKNKTFINKLIRFDAFHSAMQFLSFALAGNPYMGVGRNMAYRKRMYFENKGFSSIVQVPSGDDDLFINRVATKENTRVLIDKDAYTLSVPKKTFRDWYYQKTRHLSTAKYYKPEHKWLLALYSFTHFIFYPLFIASLIVYNWKLTLIVYGVRFLIHTIVSWRAMDKLNEKDLRPWWWILDLWMFVYYLIFAAALWKKPRAQQWK
jgi:glycosyltransferase involved in cell wall biosynthesis